MAIRRLIFENASGQRIRTVDTDSGRLFVVHCADSGRIEFLKSLEDLENQNIPYQVLADLSTQTIPANGTSIRGIGCIRPIAVDEDRTPNSPTHSLREEENDRKLFLYFRNTAVAHLVAIGIIIGLSFVFHKKNNEPELVTIVIPNKTEPKQAAQHVQVAEQKIIPKVIPHAKVAEKTRIRPAVVQKPLKVAQRKPIIRHETHRVVRSEKPLKQVEQVGALAALGGLKNGTKGYQGLDVRSLRNIRSAGVGSGGGGVGNLGGAGGVKGVLPGSGLIAGSSGLGGQAQSAGGYGTKGVGGGRAGYGKLTMVGGSSGVSLPLDEEATVEGGLDRDQIAAVINRHKGEIVYCYEQGLQGKPELSGRVAVDFVIGSGGRITRAKVAQSSLGSQNVESCMISRMKTWQFPRPVGKVNVDVLYPFELRRVGGGRS